MIRIQPKGVVEGWQHLRSLQAAGHCAGAFLVRGNFRKFRKSHIHVPIRIHRGLHCSQPDLCTR